MERLLTIDEVAEALSVSRSSVYRMVGRGELRPVRIQRRLRVPYSQVELLMQPKEES